MRPMIRALLLLVAVPAVGAEVYKSVDANGTVVYSDRPQGRNTELVEVSAPYLSGAPQPRASLVTEPEPEPEAEPEPSGPTAAERAAQRAENCARARERSTRYGQSLRLYRTLPSGEREYLSAAEIDAARAEAAADVDEWCG